MLIKCPIEQLKQSEKKKARGRKYEKDRQAILKQLKKVTGADPHKKKSGFATKKIGSKK